MNTIFQVYNFDTNFVTPDENSTYEDIIECLLSDKSIAHYDLCSIFENLGFEKINYQKIYEKDIDESIYDKEEDIFYHANISDQQTMLIHIRKSDYIYKYKNLSEPAYEYLHKKRYVNIKFETENGDKPAIIKYDADTGIIIEEEFYEENTISKNIHYLYNTGTIKAEYDLEYTHFCYNKLISFKNLKLFSLYVESNVVIGSEITLYNDKSEHVYKISHNVFVNTFPKFTNLSESSFIEEFLSLSNNEISILNMVII